MDLTGHLTGQFFIARRRSEGSEKIDNEGLMKLSAKSIGLKGNIETPSETQ
jgi:hypothetical protein